MPAADTALPAFSFCKNSANRALTSDWVG